jgi:hypothetical protein
MKKIVLLWTLLLMLINCCGCDRSPDSYSFKCRVQCQALVVSDYPIDCKVVAADYQWMTTIVTRRQLIPYDELCELYRGTPVIVRPEYSGWYSEHNHEEVTGEYANQSDQIEVTRDMTSLLHEHLHAYRRWKDMFSNKDFHDGWDKNGYYEADNAYSDIAEPLPPVNQSVSKLE